MPYVGADVQPARSKRRWDEEEDVYRVYNPEKQEDIYLVNHQRPEFTPRKILPLSKRARISDDEVHIYDELAPTHRRRTSLHRSPQEQSSYSNKLQVKLTGSLLAPCHICHRRPTKKSDLDSFAECQGCAERTCFVCIRQCPGWNSSAEIPTSLEDEEPLSRSFHMDDVDDLSPTSEHHDRAEEQRGGQRDGSLLSRHRDEEQRVRRGWDACGHRTMICSRCCVEKGVEGEVVCLGCLSRMEGA